MGIEEENVESLSSLGHNLSVKNFIWTEEEWPEISYNDFKDGDNIPIISLHGAEKEYEKTCADMVCASQKWGFFMLVDHGVDPEIICNFNFRMNSLFGLSMEQKLKGARSSDLPLGYSATNPDYGQNLPWLESLQILQSPQQVVAFATKVFGDKHQPFSDAVIRYMDALDKIGMAIFEMLARGLGLEHDFFTRNFQEKDSTMMRVNNYPPCPLPEKCLGIGSHSDPFSLTILLQDQVGGLQILRSTDHKWVGVRPVPNSFVINIGDTLEAWTNGRLRSEVHRAVVNKEKQRVSAAYFLNPALSTVIESPPELVDPKSYPRKYRSFTWEEFRNELVSRKRVLGTKSALNNKYLIS